MVVTAFSVTNKANQVRFFKKTFLLANISLEIVFEMLFPILSDADVNFLGQKLRWRTYITKETLPTTRCIELMGEKEFAAAVLELEYETYVVYVGSVNSITLPSFSPLELDVHPIYRPQISDLIVEKTFIKIPNKYIDNADVFFLDLASELPKHNRINDHAIKLGKV